MEPTNARLKTMEKEISDAKAHIQALKSQLERAETVLQHLYEQETAILETCKDHHCVLSAVRHLPEDVLREICLTCVADRIPALTSRIPLPYVLAQISSEMRHIALTTPIIWARMKITPHFTSDNFNKWTYMTLANRAIKWFERAAGLPLTLHMWDPTSSTSSQTRVEDGESDPSSILFDALLSYSTHLKEIKFTSSCHYMSAPMMRITALAATDLPMLQSVSLVWDHLFLHFVLPNNGSLGILTAPTLKCVSLVTDMLRSVAVNWAGLTSISLNARLPSSCYSMNEMAGILQQTKLLIFCRISFSGWNRSGGALYLEKIMLPFLKTLYLDDRTFGPLGPSSGTPILTDLITAPVLEILSISSIFLKSALSDFLQKSPKIWKLYLPYFLDDMSLANTIGFLHHCPSLTVLSLHPPGWGESNQKSVPDANMLMRAFIEDSDVGVLCPRLQDIKFTGNIDFSLETLQHFLDGKHSKTPTPGISPWKRVIIDIQGINAMDTRKQILNFVSQKKAEGLQVDAFLEHKKLS